MRSLVVLGLFGLIACTKHNPESCCTTSDQCIALGLGEMHGCDTGKTCDSDGTCIPVECSTSADCTSPDMPICENQICIAKCSADVECEGTAGKPYCATDGACVACDMDSQCSSDMPVCDATAHSCRTCSQDSECAGGVCLEDLGTCADSSRLIFVASAMPDAGECTSAAPCGTLTYALSKMSTVRDVIHINTATLAPASVTLDSHSGRIDGSNTLLTCAGTCNALSMASGQMTLTGLRIGSGVGAVLPLSVSGGHLTAFGVELLGIVKSTGGVTQLDSSTLDNGVNVSNGGQIKIDRSVLFGNLFINGGQLDLTRSQMRNGSYLTTATATLHIANNLILSSNNETDPLNLDGVVGSYFMFNTMVNTVGGNSTNSISCTGTIDVRDNVIAWNTVNTPMCPTQYTLYDSTVGTVPPGTGNRIGDITTFFADLANSDFHLGPSSPARAAGIASPTITTDYDGVTRPNPPDMGAFQSH